MGFGLNIRSLKAVIAIMATFSLMVGCSLKSETDFCVNHNYGTTTIHGRVVDFYTKQPIDSVQLAVEYGISWDDFLDTVLAQRDSLSFTFEAPNDCEDYYVSILNKYYWFDYDHYPAHRLLLNKGADNNFLIELKPATFFELHVKRDMQYGMEDAVRLQIRKRNTPEWESWNKITANDFDEWDPSALEIRYVVSDSATFRTISMAHDMESDVDYDVRWILLGEAHSDTLFSSFHAIPFDTVKLRYEYKSR
jgi:hypothetical protein